MGGYDAYTELNLRYSQIELYATPEDFPAFIVVDDKGSDFCTDPGGTVTVPITGVRVRSAQ